MAGRAQTVWVSECLRLVRTVLLIVAILTEQPLFNNLTLAKLRPCAFYRHSKPNVTLVCFEGPNGHTPQVSQVTVFHKGAPSFTFISGARTQAVELEAPDQSLPVRQKPLAPRLTLEYVLRSTVQAPLVGIIILAGEDSATLLHPFSRQSACESRRHDVGRQHALSH
jgi:hypothetical protein